MPPRLARLLAVIAALAMVGGALYFVTRDSGGGTGSDGTDPGNDPGGKVRIACIAELESVCKVVAAKHPEIALTVEDAGTTEAALVPAGVAPYDAWITFDPWPGMVDAGRDQKNMRPWFGTAPTALASTPLVAVMPGDRYAALVKVCGKGTATWTCVATYAGQSWGAFASGSPGADTWGTLKVGVGDPDSGLGALFVGQVATSIASANRLGAHFGSNDFTPLLQQQLKAPLASSDRKDTADQLTDVVLHFGSYSLVASTAPPASRTATSSQGRSHNLQAVQIGPSARADAIVAPLTTDAKVASRISGWFTDKTAQHEFDRLGWAFGPPKGSNGMPDADVLAALREDIR